MDLEFNLKQFKFKCLKCGNCCYNVLQETTMEHGYDYRGMFTHGPTTSVSLFYTEVLELRQNIRQMYNLELKVVPQEVLFLRDFPIGFVYQYQMKVKKNKYCMFYDIHGRQCKIYKVRPLSCRSYPIVFNPQNVIFPTTDFSCKAMKEELVRQSTSMEEGIPIRINNIDLVKSFAMEYLMYQTSSDYFFSLLELIITNLGFLLLDEDKITHDKIKEYKLLDFSQFFRWVRTNICNKNVKLILNSVERKFKQIQLDTAKYIYSWMSNPDCIQIPIKYWK